MASLLNQKGDILTGSYPIIVHQCNTTTSYARGLAQFVFDRYPYANVYDPQLALANGCLQRVPGKIHIAKPIKTGKIVINLFGQKYKGQPGKYCPENDIETAQDREDYFYDGLLDIIRNRDQLHGDNINLTIAFPHGIGCGMAGGNWNKYMDMIRNFAMQLQPGDVVYIVSKVS